MTNQEAQALLAKIEANFPTPPPKPTAYAEEFNRLAAEQARRK